AAGCRRIELYTRFEQTLAADVLERFRDWVRRAAGGEPIAYLVGEKEFYSLAFALTPAVLIPRPETEVLVQCVIDHCNATAMKSPRLLDLGTGSGCIAVTVATQLSGATIAATDTSCEALELAESNASRHGVSDRVRFMEADRLSIPPDCVPNGGFDVIMSNPPYVPRDAMDALHATVRDFEPHAALTDGGDGLSFYQSIASDAPGLLATGGVVFVEIDDNSASRVIKAVEAPGGLTHRQTWRDRVVGSERVLMFTLKDEDAGIGEQ
ncbi:MAG: peptide chain release factor N(5)-glutamine methyltransferase, partial [Planctomycetes bacterium]|nr:peptide chain release factor N(5)-glutamine methyltransferase [Planctomycetota bacterium]